MRPPSSPPSAKGLPFDFDSTFPHGSHLVNSGGREGEQNETPKRPTKAVPGWGSLGCAGSHQPSDPALSLSRNTRPRGAWKRLSAFLRDFQPQQSPGSHSALFHCHRNRLLSPPFLLIHGKSPLDMFKAPQDPIHPHSHLHPCWLLSRSREERSIRRCHICSWGYPVPGGAPGQAGAPWDGGRCPCSLHGAERDSPENPFQTRPF